MRVILGWLGTGAVISTLACANQQSARPDASAPTSDPIASYDVDAVVSGAVPDFAGIYRQMGLVNSGPPLSFVGSAAAFASQTPDTTLLVVAVSLPNRGLVFRRNGYTFEAFYDVELSLRRDSIQVRKISSVDTVRVTSLRETARTDESVIFTKTLRVAPGAYTVSYTVRDDIGGHQMTESALLTVPHMVGGMLSRPVLVYQAVPRAQVDSLPRFVPAPRSSVIFGSDANVLVYVEAYGTAITTPVVLALRNPDARVVWRDTAWLAQRRGLAAGLVSVPLKQVDVGVVTLSVARIGKGDTVRTPIFVGFGPDLPVVSFAEMVNYLRFFTTSSRINALRSVSESERATTWAAFLKATDQSPETPQNEALQEYFARIREANTQFRGDAMQGWLSDRGAVYVTLGEPSATYEDEGYTNDIFIGRNGRVRLLIWEYRDLQARLAFYEDMGGGAWRLTPASASTFRTLMARRLAR